MEMKAWHLYQDEPFDNSLLVFADTRNRAKVIGFAKGPWEWESYLTITAKRAPRWDDIFDVETVVDDNSDLPSGTAPFYQDDAVC
jgi:hypothetical protein